MIDLRAINRDQFNSAKRLWLCAVLAKVAIFVLGAVDILIVDIVVYMPVVIMGLAAISEGLQLRSDVVKSRSEALLRNLDICRSFDRTVSEADKRDIVYYVPKKKRDEFERRGGVDEYFANLTAPGPRKAVQNLLESAWYTKKQASVMALVSMVVIMLACLLSIWTLIVASHEIADIVTRRGVGQVVTSWLLLIVSVGLLRHAWAYYRLSRTSERTENRCDLLLKGDITEADALKTWYEYQTIRAGSPLLPDWLWSIMQPSLNDLWHRMASER